MDEGTDASKGVNDSAKDFQKKAKSRHKPVVVLELD